MGVGVSSIINTVKLVLYALIRNNTFVFGKPRKEALFLVMLTTVNN